MSSMTVLQVPHDGWTTDDLPDTDFRYELVDGALLVTPPPHLRHSLLANELSHLLSAAIEPGWGAPPIRASTSTCVTTASPTSCSTEGRPSPRAAWSPVTCCSPSR